MDLAERPLDSSTPETERGTNSMPIFRRTPQADTQAGARAGVLVKLRLAAVLCQHQVKPTISVEIAQGRAPLLARYLHATLLAAKGAKAAAPIAAQPQALSRIVAGSF